MATGDIFDIASRLKAWLPSRWFPDSTTAPNGVTYRIWATIQGYAAALAGAFAQNEYVRLQTRVQTATDGWLDLIAWDFFPTGLPRHAGERDDPYRTRIEAGLLAERATRAGLSRIVEVLTGSLPWIFEPARAADVGGGYNHSISLAYNTGGGYGSLTLPFQFFLQVAPPKGAGIANVGSYFDPTTRYALGGYGRGALEYGTESLITSGPTRADVYAAIADAIPAATIAWTIIEN